MFFSGDASAKKRVDMGGRSSKERDRKKLLEQTRSERNKRLWSRQQNLAALTIQKCFRGRKAVETVKSKEREQFFLAYGNRCQNVDRLCFGPNSEFLRKLLFFFDAHNVGDFSALVETCRLLQEFVGDDGDIVSLFASDYSSQRLLANYRVEQMVYACIQALHKNRYQLKDQILTSAEKSSVSTLLKAVVLFIDPKLPWVCHIAGHIIRRNIFSMFREIIVTVKESMGSCHSGGRPSLLENVLILIISHVGQRQCICPDIDPRQSLSSQILTIPFLWKVFPHLKEVFAAGRLSKHYIHQMALCMKNHANVLPNDISKEFPGYACLLGNLLEAAPAILSQRECTYDLAIEFVAVASFLLQALPPFNSTAQVEESSLVGEDDMSIADEGKETVLNENLRQQIFKAIDSRLIEQLVNILFRRTSHVNESDDRGSDFNEAAAVGAACAFLDVTFNILPLESIITILAYRTELVVVLWKYMKQCYENQRWSSLPGELTHLSADTPGWLLPLTVFCPIYKHMLQVVDNEEFYEQEKPLSLNDIRCLIIILRQALWQILWVDATSSATIVKSADILDHKRNPVEVSRRVGIVASELLSQLQDWNNRREFTPPSDFHADGINDQFISQAGIENSKAHVILKQAPFLVPFSIRVKIFISQLLAVRQRNESHAVNPRNRFRIRRDHILDDAITQLSALSESDLREVIRVSFINEFGVEEAGIDGGGIFKDFMENISRAAFDVQYGLFKETADHLLYPNPASGMVHEQHLQYFFFLGTILAKAMFEGILVDIPFATFFLSKLKEKYNYLNDLPSLDPELYRHLIFLKNYGGDVSELELYFVIVNNEYGVQTEEELLPGGKNMRVTKENVITFTHLIANHRLNYQIRHQSAYFLKGFKQLIQKDWIDMFNEHELQLLISGSLDHLDVDDLRKHTNYTGGYHDEHYVIQIFWEVMKSFSLQNQMKFLKFVTGCSRGPLLGFKYLEPPFCIQRAAGSVTEEALQRLPTAATCMNLLKLPPYGSKEQMETKLLYCISADAGFDLS